MYSKCTFYTLSEGGRTRLRCKLSRPDRWVIIIRTLRLDDCLVKECYCNQYNRITSTKCPSFWMTTFSASLRNFTALLHRSHDWSYYVSRWMLTHPPLRLQKHDWSMRTWLRTLPTSDISLGSVMLRAPEAGVFLELILLYVCLRSMIFPYFAVRFILSKYLCMPKRRSVIIWNASIRLTLVISRFHSYVNNSCTVFVNMCDDIRDDTSSVAVLD